MERRGEEDTMDAIRKQLLDKLDELTRRDAALQKHIRHQDGRNEQDWSDRAALLENDEVVDALEGDARAEIGLIRGALGRLDAGVYGTCHACEEPIAPARLKALPYATTCIECARGAER